MNGEADGDLRDTGITVNLLLPGDPTMTGMLPPDAVPGTGSSWSRR